MRAGKHIATVGCVVRWQEQRLLTTAAHALPKVGERVEVEGGGTARTLCVMWTKRSDIALLEPQFELPQRAGELPGGLKLSTSPTMPSNAESVYLFRGGASEMSNTVVSDNAAFEGIPGPDGEPMSLGPLVETPVFTVRGDSGALLFNEAFQPLATLVGGLGSRDYFMPIEPILAHLNLKLET